MKSDCAVCYVTDKGFLFPTIASFLSLRKFWKPDAGDIFVFLIDSQQSTADELTEHFKAENITFKIIENAEYDRLDETDWNKTHVPKSTIGRFLFAELIPADYHRILYLDGDTLVINDPEKLISFDPGPGFIGAAEDISSFCRKDIGAYGKFVRSYFQGIGLPETQGYFNAGVFAVQRATWETMANEALDFFLENTKACRFHDQSAMNAALGSRRKPLSLAWNFQTPYRYLDVEKRIAPAIVHFTQAGKPWSGSIAPWSEYHDRFIFLAHQLASLDGPAQLSYSEIRSLNRASTRTAQRLNSILIIRKFLRQNAIHKLEGKSLLKRCDINK